MSNQLLQRILNGETVEIGVFRVKEDFIYSGKKDADGNPIMNRVVSMVYFDEDEDVHPSTAEFDGTLKSLKEALEAHGFDAEED